MNNKQGINYLDLDVLKAFIIRETKDYDRYKEGNNLNNKGIEFADKLFKIVVEEVNKINKKSANYINIVSYGNSGFKRRELILTPKHWNTGRDIIVSFCNCGNINCWGNVKLSDDDKE